MGHKLYTAKEILDNPKKFDYRLVKHAEYCKKSGLQRLQFLRDAWDYGQTIWIDDNKKYYYLRYRFTKKRGYWFEWI